MTSSSVTFLSPLLPLATYTEAAQRGQDLYITIDGTQHQVLSVGHSQQGRSVPWLAPDIDTTSMFTAALAQTYGPAIVDEISRQLGLVPAPGKPLSSRTVVAAVDMADTAKQALSGIDFVSRLCTSATADTPIFQQACRDSQLDPSSISPAQRESLDKAMEARFEHAASVGESPVSLTVAGQWLRELLQQSRQQD